LRSIARAHLEKARSGDIAVIKGLADRLDGKPAQHLKRVRSFKTKLETNSRDFGSARINASMRRANQGLWMTSGGPPQVRIT
jgi:hypothetical protein